MLNNEIFAQPDYVKVAENQGDPVKLAVYRAGPDHAQTAKPAIVFLHGWPEIAYSWRKQMVALADAGYPVFAPDNRGFGKSDKPEGVEQYHMRHLTSDCAAILDHYGIDKAVFVGHDWGAIVLWALPFYQKDRLLGCVGLNVPLMGRPPMDPIALFRRAYGEKMYMVQFQTEGVGEAILEADMARTFRFFMRKPGKTGPGEVKGHSSGAFENEELDLLGLLQQDESSWGGVPLMSDEEIDVYVEGYKDGMTAPLHWYRSFTANYEDMARFVGEDGKYPFIDLPCLQIVCELDRACPPQLADGMDKRCGPLKLVRFDGCGHWSQQERAEDVNKELLGWLRSYF